MIAELRDELTFLVGTIPNAVVHPHVPEQIDPPTYVLQPADPFVFEAPAGPDGSTFAEPFVVGFEIILLVELSETQDNAAAGEQLDKMLDQLLEALRGPENAGGWWLDSMGQPGALLTTDWITHGQRVTVQRRVAL